MFCWCVVLRYDEFSEFGGVWADRGCRKSLSIWIQVASSSFDLRTGCGRCCIQYVSS
jgi:hypothetical protein